MSFYEEMWGWILSILGMTAFLIAVSFGLAAIPTGDKGGAANS